MNPVTTGATAFGVAQLADIIQWLMQNPRPAMPENVAMAIAAFCFPAGHVVWVVAKAAFTKWFGPIPDDQPAPQPNPPPHNP